MRSLLLPSLCLILLTACTRSEEGTKTPWASLERDGIEKQTEHSDQPVFKGNTEHVILLKVIDGDTFRVRRSDDTIESVRIIGIDTPEISYDEKPTECFAREALEALTQLTQSKVLLLEQDHLQERDQYDRLLRYVHAGDEEVGSWMIEQGFARHFGRYPHPRYETYKTLEKDAKREKMGMWGAC